MVDREVAAMLFGDVVRFPIPQAPRSRRERQMAAMLFGDVVRFPIPQAPRSRRESHMAAMLFVDVVRFWNLDTPPLPASEREGF